MVALLVACSAAEPGVDPDAGGAAGTAGDAGADAWQPDTGADAEGDSGCEPAIQMNSEQCDLCVSASVDGGSCSAQRASCAGDTECTAAIQCLQECATPACEAACIESHPQAVQPLFSYVGCVEATCHDECYCASCRFGNAQCKPCLQASCEESCTGCDRDGACMALVYCLAFGCPDPADTQCLQQCGDTFAPGVEPYNAFGACGQQSCQSACGF